ncbi:hypothetical protein Dimus_033107, partial [Dionaea muscipula]
MPSRFCRRLLCLHGFTIERFETLGIFTPPIETLGTLILFFPFLLFSVSRYPYPRPSIDAGEEADRRLAIAKNYARAWRPDDGAVGSRRAVASARRSATERDPRNPRFFQRDFRRLEHGLAKVSLDPPCSCPDSLILVVHSWIWWRRLAAASGWATVGRRRDSDEFGRRPVAVFDGDREVAVVVVREAGGGFGPPLWGSSSPEPDSGYRCRRQRVDG